MNPLYVLLTLWLCIAIPGFGINVLIYGMMGFRGNAQYAWMFLFWPWTVVRWAAGFIYRLWKDGR